MHAFLACDGVVPDSLSKKTLQGLFETIWVAQFPGAFQPFSLFIRLSGGTGTHRITVDCTNTDGRQMPERPGADITLYPDQDHDVLVHVGAIPLPTAGFIQFIAKLDGETIGWPCRIAIRLQNENT
jgi:hypothetical protein